jgi:hypothetical protein
VKKTARLKLAVEIIARVKKGMQEPRLTESVLKGTLIDTEIATLKHARALIAGAGKRSHRLPGRPKSAVAPQKQKRKMSPEGRARIVAAVKARWAAKRKAEK